MACSGIREPKCVIESAVFGVGETWDVGAKGFGSLRIVISEEKCN